MELELCLRKNCHYWRPMRDNMPHRRPMGDNMPQRRLKWLTKDTSRLDLRWGLQKVFENNNIFLLLILNLQNKHRQILYILTIHWTFNPKFIGPLVSSSGWGGKSPSPSPPDLSVFVGHRELKFFTLEIYCFDIKCKIKFTLIVFAFRQCYCLKTLGTQVFFSNNLCLSSKNENWTCIILDYACSDQNKLTCRASAVNKLRPDQV